MTRVLHSGHVVKFGYSPNLEHAGELAVRMAGQGLAIRMLADQDDNGDRYGYRSLVACLEAAKLAQWLVRDEPFTRLNCFDQNQSNACTGHGRSMQIALEDAQQIVIAGRAETFCAMPAPEVQYPFGLMIDGTLGRDYGCSGSGIVEGSEKYGSWYELDVGGYPDDLAAGNWAGSTAADEQRITAWYQRIERYATHGVPAMIAGVAGEHKSSQHANIDTPALAWAVLGHGYPVLICSNISFEANRNEEGIIRMTGHNWPHCMVISSRRTSPKYGRLYLVHQSWFANWTSGPYYLDQPVGSFWIVEADLKQVLTCQWDRRTVVRDCWVSTGHEGFAARADQLPNWVKQA